MSSFEKHRFRIYTPVQHPLKHSLDDFAYTNPGLGNQVSTVQQAIDYIFAVLYPQSLPAVDTVGDLPTLGNSLNDYRVVNDDGDGKAASYRWEKREGEVAASWHKIYDMDWGVDSILQQMELKTQDLYVSKKGYDERDASGNVVTGTFAGAYIYGGATAGNNLTFFANSGDGTGPSSGFVQFADNARPVSNNTFDLGTTSENWKKIWSVEYQAGTLNLQAGSITDSSGEIDFGSTDLTTTGALTVGSLSPASLLVGGTLSLGTGAISDTTGNIDFGSTALETTGTLDAGIITSTTTIYSIVLNPNTGGKANISATRPTLSFNALNLETTGTLDAGDAGFTAVDVDNININGNTVSATNTNGNINFVANGTGVLDFQSAMTTIGQTVTGTLSVTGQVDADNLRLDGNTLSSTNANGFIIVAPSGVGQVQVDSIIFPGTTATHDLGKATKEWNDIWASGSIKKGASATSVDTLISLRDINVGVTAGMAIFYDGTKWIASLPDTEITHGSLSGLGADDHLQYLLLAGRAGGQSVVGGTLSGNSLTLDSTAHATKGSIFAKSNVSPFTNASYSGGWSGIDLGDSTHFFRDVYTKGEFFNFRVENVSSNFASSSQNTGRIAYNTTSGLLILDTGSSVTAIGAQHSETDTVWNGTDTTKTVTVSGVADARKAVWQLKDNTNDFEQVYATITQTNATTVVITTNVALPAGTYRLIGIQ